MQLPSGTGLVDVKDTIAVSGVSAPLLTIFNVSLGLRIDFVVAAFIGCLCAMILSDQANYPKEILGFLRVLVKRVVLACASALTAGYLAPILAVWLHLATPLEFGMAFLVGAAAKPTLTYALRRFEALMGNTQIKPTDSGKD